MNCPNCNQPYEEGATVCPSCGTLLPSSAPPPAPPPAYTPPPAYAPPPAYTPPSYPTAASSGTAKASMWLGIIAVGLIVLYFIISFAIAGSVSSISSMSDLNAFTRGAGAAAVIATIFFFASPVLGLIGLILGIVALNQEKTQPTQGGRTQAIVGVVLSCVPLLCCLVMVIFILIGLSAASRYY